VLSPIGQRIRRPCRRIEDRTQHVQAEPPEPTWLRTPRGLDQEGHRSEPSEDSATPGGNEETHTSLRHDKISPAVAIAVRFHSSRVVRFNPSFYGAARRHWPSRAHPGLGARDTNSRKSSMPSDSRKTLPKPSAQIITPPPGNSVMNQSWAGSPVRAVATNSTCPASP
jgi:hypothetical protein